MRFLLIVAFYLYSFQAYSQKVFSFQQFSIQTMDGTFLANGFSGGINAAQFQEMDVNGNGTEDLVIWDINSSRVSVFTLENGDYVYLPEMSYFFPTDINGFLILADYDQDGKKDLFTSSPFGIKAYRNITPDGAGVPQWEVAQDFLRLDNGSNVQANNLDIPLITDIDGDGDLDILTFNFAAGDFLEFYRNTSQERKGIPDIDGFASAQVRWGRFEFCSCGDIQFGITCAGFPMNAEIPSMENQRIEHAGGHSLLYFDFNGDGTKDLLIGQDECSSLYFLPNKGTNSNPVFDEFTQSLADLGTLPEFPIFHTAYLYKSHLLISSHSSAASPVFNADYQQNIYQYDLTEGFELQSRAFLQEDMLDLGENSRPFFQGNKVSGELVVTGNQVVEGKTIGVATKILLDEDDWIIQDMDYLGLSKLGLTELAYTGYLSTQNRAYWFVSGDEIINQAPVKKIFYSTDLQEEDWKEISIPGFTLRGNDHITFFRYDNKDFMLLARQIGELVLMEVMFSPEPQFQLPERDFLDFTDSPLGRNLTAHVIPKEKPDLYAVDQRGRLFFIPDFMSGQDRETVLLELGEQVQEESRLGRNTWITHVPQPFGDHYDLILGNRGGGLFYLQSEDPDIPPSERDLLVKVYPNPSDGPVKAISSETAKVRMIHSSGKLIWEDFTLLANRETVLPSYYLAPGLYILQFISENGKSVSKKLWIKR